ncbi:unnamed protein product [Cylindrotheca closterium]|uniref:DUF6824 domain-containing protein n=1 Tax=Cylindrotheca closterium TaxID=2856 RepID=A0AAD2PW45_9STRA|nr:unnamed protein product [Cylindrotheca closterium]
MSTEKQPENVQTKELSREDFLNFLSKQSISKLTMNATLENGEKVSAPFYENESGSGSDHSVFKSGDFLKFLSSQDSLMPEAPGDATGVKDYNKAASQLKAKDFPSRDWHLEYGKSHVDVSYPSCFNAKSQDANRGQPSVLPPKKRQDKFDWQALYEKAVPKGKQKVTSLTPLVEAAALLPPQPLGSRGGPALQNQSSETKKSSKQTKRKPRKIIPVDKEYVDDYSDSDILFGRGGRSNHHPGNKIYRDVVTEKQPYYRNCDKNEKTKVAQSIVDMIHDHHGGRFLELDKETCRWYVVPNVVARRKVGQALRENNTEEARAAKREKYGQGKPID